MSDLIAADVWMHNVLCADTPLNVCKKRFEEFNLAQDTFIRNEIRDRIIPDLSKAGCMDAVKSYEKMLVLLAGIIEEKGKGNVHSHRT